MLSWYERHVMPRPHLVPRLSALTGNGACVGSDVDEPGYWLSPLIM